MKTTVLFLACGIVFGFITTSQLRADLLEMQNGDRYTGKVLSVSAGTVVLENEALGKINVPRNKIARLTFGTNAASPNATANGALVSVLTNLPDVSSLSGLAKGSANLPATPSNLAANQDLVRQIRDQLLAGSPEAAAKYDEMVSSFMNGTINLNDIRNQAKSSADQLRKLKKELGPEVGDSLDVYLEVLDGFLKKTAAAQTNTPPALQPPKAPVR